MQSYAVLFGRIRSHVRIAGGGFFLQAFPSVFLFAQRKPPRESSGEGTFAGRSGGGLFDGGLPAHEAALKFGDGAVDDEREGR